MSENNLVPRKRRKKSEIMNAALNTDEKRQMVGTSLEEVMVEANQPKVMSDNQLRDRLNQYLNRCYKNKQYPTVEEGLLSTGYSRQYMMDIAQGRSRGKYFTPEAADIISKFLDICAAFDAKMVMAGAAPMIGYIFRSKQHYGYSDKTEVKLSSGSQQEQDLSLDEIAKRYAVETTFAEQTFAETAEAKSHDVNTVE